jgi:hypothetical protein
MNAQSQAQPYIYGATGQLMDAQSQGQAGINQAAGRYGTAANQYGAAGNQYGTASNRYGTAESTYGKAYSDAQPYQAGATNAAMAGMRAVNPTALGAAQIGQFMDPYLNTVVGNTAQLLNQQNQQAQAGQLGNAIRSGGFGGDRAGIAAANLSQQQGLAAGSTLGGLLSQGYGQALSAAQQQQGVGLSAAQANRAAMQQGAGQLQSIGQQGYSQGMGLGQAQQGIGAAYQGLGGAYQGLGGAYQGLGGSEAALGQQAYGMGAQTAQQLAALGQQQYGMGAQTAQQLAALGQQQYGMTSGAANQIANLGMGAQTAGLQGAQAQLTAGQIAQQTKQAEDTARYNQHLMEMSYPFQTAQFEANIAEGTGGLSGSTTTTTTPASFLARGGVARSSEGGHVGFEHVGEGYAGGGMPILPGLGSADMQALLQAQAQMYAPFGEGGLYGGAATGMPGGGSSYVPQANLPVTGLTTAGDLPQQESGLEKAKQWADLAQGVTSTYETGKKDWEKHKADKIAADLKKPKASGGLVGHYAAGGGPNSGGMPYSGAGGLDIPSTAAPPPKLETAGSLAPQESGLSKLATGAGIASSAVDVGKALPGIAAGVAKAAPFLAALKHGGIVGYADGGMPYGDKAKGLNIPDEKPEVKTLDTPGAPPPQETGLDKAGKVASIAATVASLAAMAGMARGGTAGGRKGYATDGSVENNASRRTWTQVVADELEGEKQANFANAGNPHKGLFYSGFKGASGLENMAAQGLLGGYHQLFEDRSQPLIGFGQKEPQPYPRFSKESNSPPAAPPAPPAAPPAPTGVVPAKRSAAPRAAPAAAPAAATGPGLFTGDMPERQGIVPVKGGIQPQKIDPLAPDLSQADIKKPPSAGLSPLAAGSSTDGPVQQLPTYTPQSGLDRTLGSIKAGLAPEIGAAKGIGSVIGGLGKTYLDKIKAGDAATITSLLAGIGAAGSAPTNSPFAALSTGLGTGAQAYMAAKKAQAGIKQTEAETAGSNIQNSADIIDNALKQGLVFVPDDVKGPNSVYNSGTGKWGHFENATKQISGAFTPPPSGGAGAALSEQQTTSPNDLLGVAGHDYAQNRAAQDYFSSKDYVKQKSSADYTDLTSQSNAAMDNRPSLETMVKAVGDTVHQPGGTGPFTALALPWVAKYKQASDFLKGLGVSLPELPSDIVSNPQVMQKMTVELAGQKLGTTDLRAQRSLEDLMKTAPQISNDEKSNAILAAGFLVSNQQDIDPYVFYQKVAKESNLPPGAIITQGVIDAYRKSFDPEKYGRDKENLSTLILAGGGETASSKYAAIKKGLEEVRNDPKLLEERKNQIDKAYGPGFHRYFTGGMW